MTAISAPPHAFMRLPSSRAGCRMAILGIPLEGGTHPLRSGSRLGPEAVRRQSLILNSFNIEDDLDAASAVGLCDVGDVAVTHGDIPRSFAAIEAAVATLLDANVVPLTIGGDGTVTLPQLRAAAKRHPGLVVVHVDAHTDAYPDPGYIGATAFTRAAEEGLIDTRHSFHVGIRGPVRVPGIVRFSRELGYNVITMRELRKAGIDEVARRIKTAVERRPVYLCWDVDFFEPTVVPGVFTPVCDGALPHEGLELLRSLQGLNFVHFDVNNVTPQYDVHDFTALLGAHIVLTCAELYARSPNA